jgi:quinol monooxygenase YgiN
MSSALALPPVDADEAQPYALVGVAHARPDRADDLEDVLLAMVAPTRREQGALDYHIHRDRADRSRFVFYETWASREDLERHLQQPYVAAFLDSRMTYLVEDMKVSWLRMASPFS